MQLTETLEHLLNRYEQVRQALASSTDDHEAFIALSKEFSDLEPLIDQIHRLRQAQEDYQGVQRLLNTADLEADLRTMALEERTSLASTIEDCQQTLQIMLLPKDIMDSKNAILELRAGTGGDEAGLFAAELFRMYQRYADDQGWRVEPLYIQDNGIGSLREAAVSISGKGVFAKLKFESGVHRVQRVPVTETGGRIHTSTATVAVLPEAEEVDLVIDDKDLRIETMRASGAGGQHVNKTESAIRITHIPSGIVITQQDERSQHMNRQKAMKILRARLFEAERARQHAVRSQNRKLQVGTGERSERIRTYNYPQGRLTDHRINLTLYKLDQIIEGPALEEVIAHLLRFEQEEKLAALTQSDD